jgi:hypothetical protein
VSVRPPSYGRRVRVGVVGHRSLTAEGSSFAGEVCARLLTDLRHDEPRLTALSALAEGADTLFAGVAVVLAVPLEVVRPHGEYLDDFPTSRARAEHGLLWAAARQRSVMPYHRRSAAAYQAAMRWVADRSDVLVAVWDGRSTPHIGGTAETVRYARARGCRVVHVNPRVASVSFG